VIAPGQGDSSSRPVVASTNYPSLNSGY